MELTKTDLEQLKHRVKLLHKNLLAQAEMGFADHPKWPLLRGVIMDTFGNCGFEGIVNDLIGRMDGRRHEKQSSK